MNTLIAKSPTINNEVCAKKSIFSIDNDNPWDLSHSNKRPLIQIFDRNNSVKKARVQNSINDNIGILNHLQITNNNSPASFPIQCSALLSSDNIFSDCFSDTKFQCGLMKEKSAFYQPSPLPNLCATEANIIDTPPYVDTSPTGSAILRAIRTPKTLLPFKGATSSTGAVLSSTNLAEFSPYPHIKYTHCSNQKNDIFGKENMNFATKTIDSFSTPSPFKKENETRSQKKWARWTVEEDELLKFAVSLEGLQNWKSIGDKYFMGTKKSVQCKNRWRKALQPGLRKGDWTKQEDDIICYYVKNGNTKWSEIAVHLAGRIAEQVKERWYNNLDPSLKKGKWSKEEAEILNGAQREWGNSWSKIAKLLPGRSENAVKNRWYNSKNSSQKRSHSI